MTLEEGNYYKYRDVERIPKALRLIYESFINKSQGGFLVLDTDLPDTRMNVVFLLDYLVEHSGYKLVSVADCVDGAVEKKRLDKEVVESKVEDVKRVEKDEKVVEELREERMDPRDIRAKEPEVI